ncbi:MAG: hypothetical protein SGJ21_11405 [Alphaproteobacteria bacterium]|nr:hypothetical protein [Alphaproteobacteria bacterium]
MNEARFIQLLGAYGAELSRWPETERGGAEALLEVASHRLKDIWESERVFDHLLALETDTVPHSAFSARVVASVPARRPVVKIARPWAPWRAPQWAAGGAVAASLALGFAVGYAAEPVPAGSEFEQMMALGGPGAGAMFLTAVNDTGGN